MESELSTGQATAGALVIAVVRAVLHLAAPRIRRLPFVPERATGSFAGIVLVALAGSAAFYGLARPADRRPDPGQGAAPADLAEE